MPRAASRDIVAVGPALTRWLWACVCAVDRGADVAWLSQYSFEEEILFAPLTGIDVRNVRVEKASVLVVTVRLSVNLMALTIEQVIAKMKMSHLQLLDISRGFSGPRIDFAATK